MKVSAAAAPRPIPTAGAAEAACAAGGAPPPIAGEEGRRISKVVVVPASTFENVRLRALPRGEPKGQALQLPGQGGGWEAVPQSVSSPCFLDLASPEDTPQAPGPADHSRAGRQQQVAVKNKKSKKEKEEGTIKLK